jgi:hypothetical protein
MTWPPPPRRDGGGRRRVGCGSVVRDWRVDFVGDGHWHPRDLPRRIVDTVTGLDGMPLSRNDLSVGRLACFSLCPAMSRTVL